MYKVNCGQSGRQADHSLNNVSIKPAAAFTSDMALEFRYSHRHGTTALQLEQPFEWRGLKAATAAKQSYAFIG